MIRGHERGNRDCDLTTISAVVLVAVPMAPQRECPCKRLLPRPTPMAHLLGLIFSTMARIGMSSGVNPVHTEHDITSLPFPSVRTLKSCDSPFESFKTTRFRVKFFQVLKDFHKFSIN